MDEKFISLLNLDKDIRDLIQRNISCYTGLKLKMKDRTNIHKELLECVHPIGSSIDGSMTARFFEPGKPDTIECDVMIDTLVFPPEICDRDVVPVENRPGFYRIVKDEQFNQCISGVFKESRQDRLEEVMESCPGTYLSGMAIKLKEQDLLGFRDNDNLVKLILVGLFGGRIDDFSYKVTSTFNGPAVTLEMEIDLPNQNTILFSLDVSCAIRLSKWPKQADEWITRTRKWPNDQVIHKIANGPVHLVPKPSIEESDESHDEWRLTFVLAEKRLLQERTDEMVLTYYVFKILFYAHLKETVCGECLPSYFAKTTMLWACEERDPEIWAEQNMHDNLQYLLRKLKQYLEAGHLPYFFRQDMNLMRHTNRQLITHILDTNLETLILNPLGNLPKNPEDVLKKLTTSKEMFAKLNGLMEMFSTLQNM